MDDKELFDIWRAEFIETFKYDYPCDWDSFYDRFYRDLAQAAWEGYLAAKRSQPSVVLPKACYQDEIRLIEEFKERLTAAGIKYTIGE